MHALAFTLTAALFAPFALAGNESIDTQIITPARPVWLLERPYPDGPMLTARTFGDSAYGDFHTNANLEISCHPQNPAASLTLQVSPQSLGFDSDPFEGKDAPANGPLRIISGTRTAIELPANGVWTYGGAFQVGTIFAISASVPRDELAYWASDASRGQTLTLLLAPATEGAKPLKASFTLPANNNGLKTAILPCLGPDGTTTR
ncbi:hypothetical protein BFW87_27435 [Pseudomonas fluorescens]|uniref:Uncharacterized protein n=1 Tax=Pseudomonas fluorescens TaxID=294 RepID=A0A1T2XZD1_PSEFL|nr:hypothetical protein [Pseudomonas fluorescens]OPA85170.1 hypothetical protein BFW87_27435 [Pseudomonas fluorescens]